jgi:hypothetical protein
VGNVAVVQGFTNPRLQVVTGRYGIREGSKVVFLKLFYCWGKDGKGTVSRERGERKERSSLGRD